MSSNVWDIEGEGELENESGRYEPDEIDILEELYTQERVANDYIIEKLKELATTSPEEALAGVRSILEDGFAYFGEQRPWDRPTIKSLIGDLQQLELF